MTLHSAFVDNKVRIAFINLITEISHRPPPLVFFPLFVSCLRPRIIHPNPLLTRRINTTREVVPPTFFKKRYWLQYVGAPRFGKVRDMTYCEVRIS